MRRILFWGTGFLLTAVLATLVAGPAILEANVTRVTAHKPWPVGEKAAALHRTLDLADLHTDSLLFGRNLLERGSRGAVDVPRLIEGRFAVQVFSTVTKTPRGQNYRHNTADSDSISIVAAINAWPSDTWFSLANRALYQAGRLKDMAAASEGRLVILRNRADLEKVMAARAAGGDVVGGLLATEGAHPLEGRLETIDRLYDAGFRMMGLHHFFDNELGGSLHGASKAGLTPFGVQAFKAIEAKGIIVDVAHSSDKVVGEVLQMATRPMVVSHTGVRGTCDSPRNLSDTRMREIAAKGGLIGIGYWDGAVCDTSPAGVARALRYAANLIGVDHVALGSDYDGGTTVTFDASESAALVEAMLAEGFAEDDIRRIGGGNVIRFLRENLPLQ